MSITALVVARNEAARLPACLAALAPADALVVVLDRSTDASAAVARAAGATVLAGEWPVEGARRNAGIAACSTDWVLEVDADEIVPPELWAAIRRTIATSPHGFHRVRIDNFVGPRLVRHGWEGGIGTTLKPILFRRGAKHWRAQRVHPGVDYTGTEGERITEAGIHHALDADISDMWRRVDSYSNAKAMDLLAGGGAGSLANALRRAASRAVKSYVGRGGWREGSLGLLIALCAGAFPLLAHLKARLEPEKYRPAPSPLPATPPSSPREAAPPPSPHEAAPPPSPREAAPPPSPRDAAPPSSPRDAAPLMPPREAAPPSAHPPAGLPPDAPPLGHHPA